MATFNKSKFDFTTIILDNNSYDNCEFSTCKMIYRGEGAVSLTNCTFDGCVWEFQGAASNTVNFMKAIYQGMGPEGKQMIDATIKQIKGESS